MSDHLVSLLVIVTTLLAMYRSRVSATARSGYELAFMFAGLLTVAFMANGWSSLMLVELVGLLAFLSRWRWQICRPWAIAVSLSILALAAAFLPFWPRLGAHVVLRSEGVLILSTDFRPTLFVLAINLIALAPYLPYASVNRPRIFSRPVFMAVAVILLAFALGWMLGGIHFSPEKWRAIMSAPLGCLSFLIVGLAGHALIVAAIEESFFRGVLIPAIEKLLPAIGFSLAGFLPLIALVISTLLFGVAHAHLGWIWMVGATLAGFGYGLLYLTHRNLSPPVFVHSIVVLVLTSFFTV